MPWLDLRPIPSRGPKPAPYLPMDRTNMRVEFKAYAADCTVQGTVLLADDRLTDLLSKARHFDVDGVTVQAHDDGRVLHMPTATLIPGDLCAISATGPRGDAQRRLRTRQRPMRAMIGAYTIVGYLHALPTADALVTALRRPIIPMTSATIEYDLLGRRLHERHDALLMVREKIEWLESASDEEVGLVRGLELKHVVDTSAKDLTGALRGQSW